MKKILMALIICLAVFTLFSCKNEVKEPAPVVKPEEPAPEVKPEPAGEYVTFKVTEDSYDLLCEYLVDEYGMKLSDLPSYEEYLEIEYDGVYISSITILFYRNGAMTVSVGGEVIDTYEYTIDEDNCLIVDGYWIGDFSPDGDFLLLEMGEGEVYVLEIV